MSDEFTPMDNDDTIPAWLDVLVMVGTGALAGAAAAAITGRDVKSRAAGAAVTFGLMTIAWRAGTGTENKVRQLRGLPPVKPHEV